MLSLLASSALAATPAAPRPFPDVPADHDNVKAVTVLRDAGLFGGYPDGTFRPDQTINRAELLKIFIMSIGNDTYTPITTENCFVDVRGTDWFSPYVCRAAAEGWVEGYADGMFRPEQQVTLVEALKMLATVRQYESVDAFPAEGYPRNQWFTPYIDIALAKDAVSLQTITGTPAEDGLDKPLTRMRAAEILYRAMLDDGRVNFLFDQGNCKDLYAMQTVELRKYDLKYNADNTAIVDFDIHGRTKDGKECVIGEHANPYAGVSRWWNSRTMFLVDGPESDTVKEEIAPIERRVYLRLGHETAGLGKYVWLLNLNTGIFSMVSVIK